MMLAAYLMFFLAAVATRLVFVPLVLLWRACACIWRTPAICHAIAMRHAFGVRHE